MIPFDSALESILNLPYPFRAESVPAGLALHSTLAEPLRAPFGMPVFDNSAVDGIAIHRADIPNPPSSLKIVGCVQAGQADAVHFASGESVRVLTGAQLPEETGAVVMQEDVTFKQNLAVLNLQNVTPGQHIRKRDSEFRAGDELLPVGSFVTPATLSLAASLNLPQLKVRKKPSIAILVTGNELKEQGETLQMGQIYESNSVSIAATLKSIGINSTLVRLPDEEAIIRSTLADLLMAHDIIITIGGVSVGAFDFIRPASKANKLEVVVPAVAMKPGKPFFCAYRENDSKILFGLPGNPMSALISFSLFAWQYIRKCMGVEPPCWMSAEIDVDYKNVGIREEFIPAILKPSDPSYSVEINETIGSHSVAGLCLANALVRVPPSSKIVKGQRVPTMLLPWGVL